MPLESVSYEPVKVRLGRRQFLKRLATAFTIGALVTGPLVACGDPVTDTTALPVITKAGLNSSTQASATTTPAVTLPGFDIVGSVSNFKPDADPAGFAIKGKNVLVFNKSGEGFYVFSDICTHQGCQVEYAPKVKKFLCPCHNSEFDRTGEVVRGPAQIRLAKFEFKVIGSNLLVKVD